MDSNARRRLSALLKQAAYLLEAKAAVSANAATRIEKSWKNLNGEQKLNLLSIVFFATGLDAWEETVLEELGVDSPEQADPQDIFNLFKLRLSRDSLIDGYIPWLANKLPSATDSEVAQLNRSFLAICRWASETKTDIGKFSVARALEEAHSFVPRASKKAVEDSDANPVVYRFADGFKVVNLKTDEALRHEGDRMKHCVGNYCEAVGFGDSVIYSIRSPDNDPEKDLTLEYQPEADTFTQVFGVSNRDPKPEQRKYVIEFIEAKYPHDIAGLIRAGKPAKELDLKGDNLSGADLRGTDLSGVDLRGADLSGAYLSEANLQRADLRGANLKNANLEEAKLEDADLEEANLEGAYLKGAELKYANLNYANVRNANLDTDISQAYLEDIVYNNKTRWPDGFKTYLLDRRR